MVRKKAKPSLNGATLLVCGGAGFIGSNFIRQLLEKYPRIKIVNLDKLTYSGNLDNLRDIARDPRYTFVRGDIAGARKMKSVFKKYVPDYVINFAAETHVDRSIHVGALEFINTNVVGVFNILEAVKASGRIRKFVQVSCYDEQTRAWTREGLKYHSELKPGDEVLTRGKDGRVSLEKIEKVIVQDYENEMVAFDNGRIDLLVTPNHRMMLHDGSFVRADSSRAAWNLATPVSALPQPARMYDIPGYGSVPLQSLAYVVGFFIGDGFTAYQEKITASKTGLRRDAYLQHARGAGGRFGTIGRMGTEAHVTCKAWRVFFDVPLKDKGRKRLEKELDALGVKWHAEQGKAGEHIYCTSEHLMKFFDTHCGKGARQKKIPSWIFSEGADILQSILDGLVDSDGYRRENAVSVVTTVSEHLMHNIVELGTRLGRSISVRKSFNASVIEGRSVQGEAYYVLIGNGTGERYIRADSVKKKQYKGKVWCVTVKNKNFLVERNGKYVFCGNTDEVYGSLDLNSKELFTETTAFAPNVPYAATKAGGDMLCRAYHSTWKAPVVVTHCSNNYGPRQYPEKLIPFFVLRMLEGKKLPLYGDGRHVRDWIYVLDHCRALELCLLRGRAGAVYNIGADNEMSNREIAALILEYFGKGKRSLEFVRDRPGHDRRYAIDATLIHKELGWKPEHPFKDAFRETIRWYTDNMEWIERVRRKTGVFNPHIDLWRTHTEK